VRAFKPHQRLPVRNHERRLLRRRKDGVCGSALGQSFEATRALERIRPRIGS